MCGYQLLAVNTENCKNPQYPTNDGKLSAHLNDHSTIHLLGSTMNIWASLRLTTSTFASTSPFILIDLKPPPEVGRIG